MRRLVLWKIFICPRPGRTIRLWGGGWTHERKGVENGETETASRAPDGLVKTIRPALSNPAGPDRPASPSSAEKVEEESGLKLDDRNTADGIAQGDAGRKESICS